jgi:hypothetical protein
LSKPAIKKYEKTDLKKRYVKKNAKERVANR